MADRLYCSFCAKSQHEVRKLVAGPGNFICNECIDLCHDIVHDKPSPPPRESDEIPWFEWTMRVVRIERALMDLRLAINDARFKRYQPPPDKLPAEIISFAKPDAHQPPGKPDDDEPRLRDIQIGFGKLDDDDPSEKS